MNKKSVVIVLLLIFTISCSKKEGCLDDNACNFETTAEVDDGSCVYAIENFDCENECINDYNNDGICEEFSMVSVPAGAYTYGHNNQDLGWMGNYPMDTLTIDYDFEMMKYEVTNAQYLTYLEEALANGDITVNGNSVTGYYGGDENNGAGDQPFYSLGTPSSYNYARISYNGNNFQINEPAGFTAGEFANHPVVYVSWYGANAFAEFYGMRLPTEHEWEKTARGNTGADYPWGENYGDTISDNANYGESNDPWDNGTSPVGYFNGENNTTNSPSPYGAYDMAGNVWEWTDSWWSENDPFRVWRGGSWTYDIYDCQAWSRDYYFYPALSSNSLGFRVARTQ